MTDNPNSTKFISIIIPDLNSPLIGEVIEAVKNQKISCNKEIIIIGKDKWKILQNFSEDIKFIETIQPVSAAKARNIGLKESKGDLLVFIDADCIAQENWLSNLVYTINEGFKVVGGGVTYRKENFLSSVYNIAMLHEFFDTKKREIKNYLPTLNLAIKREVVNKIGYLNEEFLRCEDLEWTLRMKQSGYKLLFEPSAIILHKPFHSSFKSLGDTFFEDGFFSIQNRFRFSNIYEMPNILRYAIVWKFFSLIISTYSTIKIYFKTRQFRENIRAFPHIFILKFYWCLGAAKGIKYMKNKRSK